MLIRALHVPGGALCLCSKGINTKQVECGNSPPGTESERPQCTRAIVDDALTVMHRLLCAGLAKYMSKLSGRMFVLVEFCAL